MKPDVGPPPETVTANVALSGPDWQLQARMTVPTGPTKARELLPLFQSLSDALVGAAVHAVEEQGGAISCKKGCGACCRMMVPVSHLEARHLRDLVEGLPEPRRSTVRERFAAARRRVEEADLTEKLRRPEQWTADDYTAVAGAYFRLGIACPFLEDESCSIHPQRPVTCREYLVTSPPELCGYVAPPRPVNRVRIPLRVFNAVSRLEAPESAHTLESWVPLVLALEWADAHPDEAPPRPGPEILREFLDHLAHQRGKQ
jgi:Fe-S-cluster containining protein